MVTLAFGDGGERAVKIGAPTIVGFSNLHCTPPNTALERYVLPSEGATKKTSSVINSARFLRFGGT